MNFSTLENFIDNLPKMNFDEVKKYVFDFIQSLTFTDITFCIRNLRFSDLEDNFYPRQLSYHGINDTNYSERQFKYTERQLLYNYAIKYIENKKIQ